MARHSFFFVYRDDCFSIWNQLAWFCMFNRNLCRLCTGYFYWNVFAIIFINPCNHTLLQFITPTISIILATAFFRQMKINFNLISAKIDLGFVIGAHTSLKNTTTTDKNKSSFIFCVCLCGSISLKLIICVLILYNSSIFSLEIIKFFFVLKKESNYCEKKRVKVNRFLMVFCQSSLLNVVVECCLKCRWISEY